MIRRSPAEMYLKFLVSSPDRYTNDDIKRLFDYAQLEFIGTEYLERLRATCIPPVPFKPKDDHHMPSYRFILKHGLRTIYKMDEHGRAAFALVEQPRVKEFLETMILAHAPAATIAHALTTRHRIPTHPSTVERYRCFFWNVDLLDTVEMRALLALRYERAKNSTDPEIREQYEALKYSSYNDPRRIVASMPYSPISAIIAQMRMGYMPSKLDLAKVLTVARDRASLCMYEELSRQEKGSATRAMEFSTVMRIITDVLETVVKPDEQMRQELATLSLANDPSVIPSIHELSAGAHTVDMGTEKVDELPEPATRKGS